MKSLITRSATPIGAFIAAALLMIAVAIIVMANITHAGNGEPGQDGRLVTIHDRGTEKVILTQAETVGNALAEAGIVLDPKDTVEPDANQKLVASDYQVNIYRARPVIVVDGAIKQKIITPYQTAPQIVKDAGIKLYPEDTTKLERVNDIIAEGAGLRLTIDRATPFSFTLYGETVTARTQAKTVGDMLTEKGIKLGANDRVSVDKFTPMTSDLSVRVWREGKQTVTVDESIDFAIDKISDANREPSYREIRTPGENGSRSVTYEVDIQDGKEVARTEIASIVTKQPKTQVEVVGVKGQYTTPSENQSITWGYLIGQGFTRNQTAGIMGNLMQEHRFNTSGDGLAQWTGGRKAKLMAMPNPYNIYTQLDFLMSELNSNYLGVQNAIRASSSVESVVTIFQDQFERCGICAESNRIQYAYNILASH